MLEDGSANFFTPVGENTLSPLFRQKLTLFMIFRYIERSALVFIAVCAITTCASAQNKDKNCEPANLMKAEQLFGTWAARFDQPPPALPGQATLRLERHAEFSDSLAGEVNRDFGRRDPRASGHSAKAALAGDLQDGFLVLDESSDNVSITGTWNAEMVEGSCGRIFQGVWKDTSASAPADAPDLPFTLTKNPEKLPKKTTPPRR